LLSGLLIEIETVEQKQKKNYRCTDTSHFYGMAYFVHFERLAGGCSGK
jgi:hypothetical protein